MFGGKLIGHNDPGYQEKVIRFNELLANCVMYSTALDITDTANDIAAEGQSVDVDDLATVSPTSPIPSASLGTGPSTSPRQTTCRTPAWISNRGCCSPRPPHDPVRGRHDDRPARIQAIRSNDMGDVREGLGEMASPAGLGQALAAIGLFRHAPSEADMARELERLGSAELLRLELANWLLGAAAMQVLMAETLRPTLAWTRRGSPWPPDGYCRAPTATATMTRRSCSLSCWPGNWSTCSWC
jgi:hypothetical protein